MFRLSVKASAKLVMGRMTERNKKCSGGFNPPKGESDVTEKGELVKQDVRPEVEADHVGGEGQSTVVAAKANDLEPVELGANHAGEKDLMEVATPNESDAFAWEQSNEWGEESMVEESQGKVASKANELEQVKPGGTTGEKGEANETEEAIKMTRDDAHEAQAVIATLKVGTGRGGGEKVPMAVEPKAKDTEIIEPVSNGEEESMVEEPKAKDTEMIAPVSNGEEESMVVEPKAKDTELVEPDANGANTEQEKSIVVEPKAKDYMKLVETDSNGRPSTVEEESMVESDSNEASTVEEESMVEPDSNTGQEESVVVGQKAKDTENGANTGQEESVVVASQANELEQMNPDANAGKKQPNAKRKKNRNFTYKKKQHKEKQQISFKAKSYAKQMGMKPREAQKKIDTAS